MGIRKWGFFLASWCWAHSLLEIPVFHLRNGENNTQLAM